MTETLKKESRKTGSHTKRILLSSLFVLVFGCIGYFSLIRGTILFYIFAHLGALGILGLIGGAVGILARKKGRSYSIALLLGILLPIVTGVVAALIVGDHVSCGGSVSLAVAIFVTVFYTFIRKRSSPKVGLAG